MGTPLGQTLPYNMIIIAPVARACVAEVPQDWPECAHPLDLEDHVIALEQDHEKSKTNSSLSMKINLQQTYTFHEADLEVFLRELLGAILTLSLLALGCHINYSDVLEV
jgi:hypothetical protein